jgi:hypothetical protein
MSTASPESSAFATVVRRARSRFLLTDAIRQAAARPAARQELIRTYYAAALDRTTVADQLNDERGAVAAMLLYQQAMPLLVAAVALTNDPEFPASADPLPAGTSAWEVLADLRQRQRLPALPKKLEQARAALETSEPLGFDRLPPQTLLDRRSVVQATVHRLQALIEPRTPSQLKVGRLARVTGAVLLLALLVLALAASLRHPNLALKKPVSASSRHPASTAPADNSGLTNGEIEATFGIETAPGPSWVMIDLQEDQKVSRVKIFNRRDGSFDAGLPLTLETSADGVTFAAADTRAQPFSSSSPWIWKAPSGTHFRFLRVRSNTLVALTEIEVY